MTKPREGIYFGLPAPDYHDDPAFGSHDMVELATLPAEWQWNRLFPPEEEKRADHFVWGHAFHSLILDGQEEFERRHPVIPSKDDYPNALDTVEDMKGFCAEHNVLINSGVRKAKLAEAIRKQHPRVQFWDEIVEATKGNPEAITRKIHDQILLASAHVTKHPQLGPAFQGGVPEISVFWHHPIWRGDEIVDEVRCKARFDYSKIRATVDLKSIRTWAQRSFERMIMAQIANLRYDVQFAHYKEGREQFQRFIDLGMVYGYGALPDDLSDEWLERVAAMHWSDDRNDREGWVWVWVFVKKEGAPLARGYIASSDVLEAGRSMRQVGFDNYLANVEKFGRDEIWIVDEDLDYLNMDMLPAWMGAA